LKPPKRVKFLPQQNKHTTITLTTTKNKSLTTYNNNNTSVTCCKTFQTSKYKKIATSSCMH
jgi:hypothetical protein